MKPEQLAEIRERDATDFGTIGDRRALLAYVDSLHSQRQADIAALNLKDAEIARLRDELQASQCAERMSADIVKAQHERITAMESKLRELAGECAECDGFGNVFEPNGDSTACPDCADIRALQPKERA